MLRGRPFGGVMILIKKALRKYTTTIHCDARFVIIKVYNYLFTNVYLPCSGTMNRSALYKHFVGGHLVVARSLQSV